jgi:hypothetical protein
MKLIVRVSTAEARLSGVRFALSSAHRAEIQADIMVLLDSIVRWDFVKAIDFTSAIIVSLTTIIASLIAIMMTISFTNDAIFSSDLTSSRPGSRIGGTPITRIPTTTPITITHRSTIAVYWSGLATAVQTELARRGYYHGSTDGVMGPESRQAIRKFQETERLPVTGLIDPSLLKALRLPQVPQVT